MALGKKRFNVRAAYPKDKLKFKFFSSPVSTVCVCVGGGGGDSARALCTCNHLHMCSVVHEVELIFKRVSRQRFMFACGVENFTIFDLVSPSKLYH